MCLPNCQPVVIIQSFPGVHGSVIAEGIIGGVVCVASEPSCSPSLVFFSLDSALRRCQLLPVAVNLPSSRTTSIVMVIYTV